MTNKCKASIIRGEDSATEWITVHITHVVTGVNLNASDDCVVRLGGIHHLRNDRLQGLSNDLRGGVTETDVRGWQWEGGEAATQLQCIQSVSPVVSRRRLTSAAALVTSTTVALGSCRSVREVPRGNRGEHSLHESAS